MLLSVIAAVICEGHILIEGMPWLGKTLTISTISKLMNLQFNRIQFTPDLPFRPHWDPNFLAKKGRIRN